MNCQIVYVLELSLSPCPRRSGSTTNRRAANCSATTSRLAATSRIPCTNTSGGFAGSPSVSTFSVAPADATRRYVGSLNLDRRRDSLGSSALDLHALEVRLPTFHERADAFAEVVAFQALGHQLVRIAHRLAERH